MLSIIYIKKKKYLWGGWGMKIEYITVLKKVSQFINVKTNQKQVTKTPGTSASFINEFEPYMVDFFFLISKNEIVCLFLCRRRRALSFIFDQKCF